MMTNNQDFKVCIYCKHYLHRHELENSCSKFKTSQDVLTGLASYKHVREARANDALCGKSAKLYEQQEQKSSNSVIGLILIVWVIMFAVVSFLSN